MESHHPEGYGSCKALMESYILIMGATKEHLRALEEVLRCLEKAGLRVKRNKCAFMILSYCQWTTYLGHRVW